MTTRRPKSRMRLKARRKLTSHKKERKTAHLAAHVKPLPCRRQKMFVRLRQGSHPEAHKTTKKKLARYWLAKARHVVGKQKTRATQQRALQTQEIGWRMQLQLGLE
jgi:hypothetical protein